MNDIRSRMTSKGQVTLPKSLRSALSLHEGDNIQFSVEVGGRVVLYKQDAPGASSGCGRKFIVGKKLAPANWADIDTAVASAMAQRATDVYVQKGPDLGDCKNEGMVAE